MHDSAPDGRVVLARYARAWTALVIIGALGLSVGLIVVGYVAGLSPKYLDAFRAVGESILASLVRRTSLARDYPWQKAAMSRAVSRLTSGHAIVKISVPCIVPSTCRPRAGTPALSSSR